MESSQHSHANVEPKNSTADGPDDDPPRRSENKRKRFHPFRVVRNIFSRKTKRQDSEDVQSSSKKSRSTSELTRVSNDVPQFPGLAPPYAVGLSVSHDSIFTPEHGNAQEDIQGSSLSVQHVGLKGFKDELFTRVRARRDSDDDDVGLPHSPCTSPTTADVLAQGLKDKSSKSRSTCSASSLLSMGSSENDEDSVGQFPSRFSYTGMDRRSADLEPEMDATQPVPLNHNAALHRIAVRPKRTYGLPQHRKLQQMAASAVRLTLPATPEVTEDAGKVPPSLPSPNLNHIQQIDVAENVMAEDAEIQEDEPSSNNTSEPVPVPKKEDKPLSPVSEGLKVSEIPSIEVEPFVLPTEKEIHVSKGKSAAAELKLRHEIKEFSKRQNEKREQEAKVESEPPPNEDEAPLEIADVKESIKSLESTITVGEISDDTEVKMLESSKDENLPNLNSWCLIEVGENDFPKNIAADPSSVDDQLEKTVICVTDKSDHFVKEQCPEDSEKVVKESKRLVNNNVQDLLINDSAPKEVTRNTVEIQSDAAPSQPVVQLASDIAQEENKNTDESEHVITCTVEQSSPDQNEATEIPRVMLRRQRSNKSEQQKDFNRASADMTPSQNFSDIMKHRRSLVDGDTSALDDKKNLIRSISEETSRNSPLSNRVSVEIMPFSQRSKIPPNIISSVPLDNENKTEDGNPSEINSESANLPKTDKMQYPVRFRIRKGSRSFSEVKDSGSHKNDLENKVNESRPVLRPKPQLQPKDDQAKNTTPEFMRIQLRSSKEDLDKPDTTPSPPITAPQWEVKILQKPRNTTTSLPYIPAPLETRKIVDSSTEVIGNKEKPQLEKQTSDPKTPTVENNANSTENSLENSKIEETKTPKDNGLSSSSTEKSMPTLPQKITEEGSVKVPGSTNQRSSQEPELFRVFARRSIKQKHSEKSSETTADASNEKKELADTSGQEEKAPKMSDSSGQQRGKPIFPQQTLEPKITETPKKQGFKVSVNETPKKTETSTKSFPKDNTQKVELSDTNKTFEDKTELETRVISIAKTANNNYINNNVVEEQVPKIPAWRNAAKSKFIEGKQVETSIQRRNSAPPEPKMTEKENLRNKEPTQVTVSIQPQRSTINLTRNDSHSKLMANNKESSMSGGNTPSWMQLAQQRREQREQKERMLYAATGSSSFVLEANSRPSRNSKVLDMVNNFQKLQTT